MKIYVVILHYKDIDATKTCVATLRKHEKSVHIIIVNNDVTSLPVADFPDTSIINNKKNLGFAAGVNIGIKKALKEGADAVLLLNNDTIITQPFLSVLTSQLERDSSIGIIGPAISFEKEGKKVFDIGGFINMWTGKTHHEEVESTGGYMPRTVPYITGAAMLIKREVFEKVGFFDEKFFFYYEDADFCLRAQKKGFSVMVNPQVSVIHLLGKTSGRITPFATFHQTRSALLFGKKYFSTFPRNIFHLLFITYQACIFLGISYSAGIAALRAIFSEGTQR